MTLAIGLLFALGLPLACALLAWTLRYRAPID